MKISLIIPILYSLDNFLYKKAVSSVLKSWENYDKSKGDTIDIVLVFNNYPLEKDTPNLVWKEKDSTSITTTINKGFTGAVNDGLWFSVFKKKADWCLVLNDDAFVDENFFSVMIPNFNSGASLISCGVKNVDGTPQSYGLDYYSTGLTRPLVDFKNNDFFVGTVFFVSEKIVKQSFENYGFLLMDFFFAYAEDLELSIRLKRDGKKIKIVSKKLVTHLGSVTAKRGSSFQLFWGYRNLMIIILMHWPLKKIILNLPQLIYGQLYIMSLLLAKGHLLVYIKIMRSIFRIRPIISFYRKGFNEKLPISFSI